MSTHSFLKLAIVSQLALAPLVANQADDLAGSLMKLRAEVEALDTKITDSKDEYKASMRSLLRQKDDLESVIAREDLKIKQIQQELDKVRKEIKENSKNSEGLKPLLIDALATLENNIKMAIPFKTEDRLADVEKIRNQIEQDLVSPQKGLALVWNGYGDAMRMTKENGIFKQTIQLDGQDRLVEVARVGTMMMFFKAPDETVGYVTKDGSGWNYKTAVNKADQENILTLFDAFKKQIRTGYFTLPNAVVMTEAN